MVYEQAPINPNHKIVLKELQNCVVNESFNGFQAIYWMLSKVITDPHSDLSLAYRNLDVNELNHILRIFSIWMLDHNKLNNLYTTETEFE